MQDPYTYEGHGDRIEDPGESTEEERDQDRADKDGKTVLPAVSGGERHHGDGKNEHKEAFEHSARLSVDQEQNAEDSYDHGTKG